MAMGLAGGGGGRRRRGRRGRAPMAEINVTPFVDVMLVLLIIFMVTAPLLKAGVPIDLPDSRAKALSEEREQITLTITPEGRLYLNTVEVSLVALSDDLTCDKGDGLPPLVTLRADRALDYGTVMAVMGELNRAGCNAITLVTNAAGVLAPAPESAVIDGSGGA